MKVENALTILIPTLNRHENLARYLPYLLAMGFIVIVADGSEKPFLYSAEKNLNYFHMPNATFKERLYTLYLDVKTDFVVVAADDDFLGHNGLIACMQFLINNREYSGCQGYFTQYQYKNFFGKKLLLNNAHSYGYSHEYKFEEETSTARLSSMTTNKIMHYCYAVVKKNVLGVAFDLWKDVESKDGDTILFEPLMMFAVGIVGKFKTLDIFFNAREISQGGRFSSFEQILSEGNNREILTRNFCNSVMKSLDLTDEIKKIIENYCNQLNKHASVRANRFKKLTFQFRSFAKNILLLVNIVPSDRIGRDFFKEKAHYELYLVDWRKINERFKA